MFSLNLSLHFPLLCKPHIISTIQFDIANIDGANKELLLSSIDKPGNDEFPHVPNE